MSDSSSTFTVRTPQSNQASAVRGFITSNQPQPASISAGTPVASTMIQKTLIPRPD